MYKEKTYSPEKIVEICEEIERQWEYHLVTRSRIVPSVFESSLLPKSWS
jgi:hypothetical protein